jgi:hypothetical protein
MLIPIIVSSAFALAVVILCLMKPNAGRIFLGLFFLAMAIGVNGSFTLTNPQSYVDYASGALIPLYRDIALAVVELNPVLFGLLLMAFEITMGLLLLHKHRAVKVGLIGTMVFVAGIAPLSIVQIPWLGLLIGQAYLLTKDFDTTFLETIRHKLGRGATQGEVQRSLPGDELVPSPKSGYTQAITIRAPKTEVWPWLVQIGYKRAGWYSHDFLHRLVGIAGCVDDERCSAKRIIPELQGLRIGDVIEIAPGMGYTVAGLEPEQALVLQSILDTGKWESVSSDDPLPEKYLRSGWVWFLEEIDEKTTRLIVRVQSDHDPGLLSTLSTAISNILGRMVMQPKTLRVLKQRAEMSAR